LSVVRHRDFRATAQSLRQLKFKNQAAANRYYHQWWSLFAYLATRLAMPIHPESFEGMLDNIGEGSAAEASDHIADSFKPEVQTPPLVVGS
jgi:hypothetical protein